ncbi:hypothetical protein LJC20_06275 [Eubacteriales bacterium OttesenSCG-928-M02]|nr:hypothetical protein [Eubacteriales bacterium OttesenSCG-928-M02]
MTLVYMGGALAFSVPGAADLAQGENILSPSGQIVAAKRKRKGNGQNFKEILY